MLNKVKLANGTEVDWEEFSKWGAIKQHMSVIGCRGTKGFRHSEKTRKLISDIKKKQVVSAEQRAHLSKVMKGKYKNCKKNLPIHTPNGLFPNRITLYARMVEDGFASKNYAAQKIRQWMKEYPNDYYLISG
ncbi:hypothetical protein B6A14_08435 [Polynucleobacter hirudinilacicola]|uniref:Uncharacterized protein n=1 Tax=Polynucleobacter hirudinilacicola TaxID=1743166 RepID=A0A210RXU1_9BURK|nr:hypothetical protein [Polynucleobacter hirudinilacicola]OWF65784.1 hypothetical protein B6A14_08435 [Polynucleobacter hirudinilacicola]